MRYRSFEPGALGQTIPMVGGFSWPRDVEKIGACIGGGLGKLDPENAYSTHDRQLSV